MKFEKMTLKNGVWLITVPMQGTVTATLVVMVGVGSRYEKGDEAGVSHFIEHMLFKGTKKRPTSLSITEELDAFGGEYNAFTAKDRTEYHVKVDSRHIHDAFDIISDMVLNSKLEAKEIEKERGTIIQEINMYEDTPQRNIWDVFENFIYDGNTLGRDIVGSKKTVASLQRKNFVDYMKKHYTADRTIVCVAGKFDKKKIISETEKYFGSLQKGKGLQFEKIVEKQSKPAIKIKFKKTDQTHVVIGNRAYHHNHKDRYVLATLGVILGGNMSSRLFTEVRERRGLAYHVKAGADAYQDCGYFATYAGIDHGKLEDVLKVILGEYKKIASEKVSEKELQKAKDFMKGRAVMNLEASDEVAMFFVEQEFNGEKLHNIQDSLNKIDAVTSQDILRVAKDIFKKEKLNCAVIGPHRYDKKLYEILKSGL